MLEINHIQSGSAGNCILIRDNDTCIGLDAGVSLKRMQKEFGIRITDVNGWLVTHEHGDHCSQVPELLLRGSEIYMSGGTARAFGYASKDVNIVNQGERFQVGNMLCTGFIVHHDAKEPFGFLIKGQDFKLCYIADSNDVPDFVKDFKGVTHWLMECNYEHTLLDKSEYHSKLRKRVDNTHMSLKDVQSFFDQVDLSKSREIHLVHISGSTGDRLMFEKSLERITGIPVYT